jgi:hypothetical protein
MARTSIEVKYVVQYQNGTGEWVDQIKCDKVEDAERDVKMARFTWPFRYRVVKRVIQEIVVRDTGMARVESGDTGEHGNRG